MTRMAGVIKVLEMDRKIYSFKIKDIWWADEPYDVSGCDGVTFHACKNKVDVEGFSCEEFTTLVIDLTQDLDMIWKNMSKSSCRYAINRAKKDGVKIELSRDFDEFYDINCSFKKKKKLALSYLKPEIMEKYGTLFVLEFDEEILGGQLYLEDENNMRWLVGASKRLEVGTEKATLIGNANKLLIWEAINYAKEKGIKEFDMGGYYTGGDKSDPRYTINIFKQSFGAKLATYYIYRKYYSKIYKLFRGLYQLKEGGL